MASVKSRLPGRREPSRFGVAGLDFWLAGAALTLVVVGLVMVFSASAPIALRKFGDSSHYAVRNLIFASLGLLLAIGLSQLPIKAIRNLSRVGFWITIVLLLLVLVPGIGMEAGGARRWIHLAGISLQPSELFKIMLILYVAHLLVIDPSRVRRIKGGLLPLMVIYALGAGLLMAEPDFGSTLIIGAVLLGMVFIAGIPFAWIVMMVVVAIPAAAAGVMMARYRLERVMSFWDPWDDPTNTDFQLVQSLLSFGNGGLTGIGLGEGTQKQFYLPESHTDFIFAVIGEELGLAWVLFMIALFAFLVWRAFSIARRHPDPFARLSAAGISMLFGTQAFANMAVVMGLLPPKGLTLPLVSYGGSSLVVTMGAIGLLLAFSRAIPSGAAARPPPPVEEV